MLGILAGDIAGHALGEPGAAKDAARTGLAHTLPAFQHEHVVCLAAGLENTGSHGEEEHATDRAGVIAVGGAQVGQAGQRAKPECEEKREELIPSNTPFGRVREGGGQEPTAPIGA